MLDVPAKSVLVISYIGYVTQEVPTAGKNSLEIVLKEDTKTLDEVVVIGYGTQRKGDVTSSVASVKADNFVKGAVKDVGQLIQGKVAGLAITNLTVTRREVLRYVFVVQIPLVELIQLLWY